MYSDMSECVISSLLMIVFRSVPSVKTNLGEVELERIISGQRNHQASGKVLWQWVAVVTEEQAVVTQW